MAKKQRPAEVRAKRQIDIVIAAAVNECAALRKAVMVDGGIDRVAGRGGREHVSDEAFVPAADVMIEAEAIVGTPMPGQDMVATLRVPIPFGVEP